MLTGPSLTGLFDRELHGGCRGVVVDLGGCSFLGSVGLAALVAGLQRADELGVPLVLAAVPRIAARALEVTGLASMFTSYPSGNDAAVALEGC